MRLVCARGWRTCVPLLEMRLCMIPAALRGGLRVQFAGLEGCGFGA